MNKMLFLLTVLLPSQALADGPYMWGVGPTINTMVYPGEHPAGWPGGTKVDNDEGKKEPLLDKTRGDVGMGVHGVLYMRKHQRIGTHAWYATGANGFRSPNFTLEYDFQGTEANGVGVLGGFGVGLGSQRWETEGAGELKMATYILRAQGSVNYRTKKNMFEIGLFFNMFLPGKQLFTPNGGEEDQVKGGFYPVLGLEGTMYFGDFKPPAKKNKKGKKKKRGRR